MQWDERTFDVQMVGARKYGKTLQFRDKILQSLISNCISVDINALPGQRRVAMLLVIQFDGKNIY
jgi:hypothetical protein